MSSGHANKANPVTLATSPAEKAVLAKVRVGKGMKLTEYILARAGLFELSLAQPFLPAFCGK
jgi:hypothetical protein